MRPTRSRLWALLAMSGSTLAADDFVVGGLWPLVSMGTFEKVFGPKADRWLAYTVAGLLVTNGATQLLAVRGRLRWTYLLDAALELGWLALWRQQSRGGSRRVLP